MDSFRSLYYRFNHSLKKTKEIKKNKQIQQQQQQKTITNKQKKKRKKYQANKFKIEIKQKTKTKTKTKIAGIIRLMKVVPPLKQKHHFVITDACYCFVCKYVKKNVVF